MFRYFPSEPTFFLVALVWIIYLKQGDFFIGSHKKCMEAPPNYENMAFVFVLGILKIPCFRAVK